MIEWSVQTLKTYKSEFSFWRASLENDIAWEVQEVPKKNTQTMLDQNRKASFCLTYPMSVTFFLHITVIVQNRDTYTLEVPTDLER